MGRDISKRKVHKPKKGAERGTLAELHDLLVKRGFSVVGIGDYFMTGKEEYRDPLGSKAFLRRIEKGKPAMWTGRKVGLVRTAATPDIWQLIMGEKK